MPGYVIGVILLAAAAVVFVVLLWNALELTADEQERPRLRRRLLAALLGAPAALVAIAFVVLARSY